MTEKKIIRYPAWHDEARKMKAKGKTVAQLADHFGTSHGRMSHIATANWKAYILLFMRTDRSKMGSVNDWTNCVDDYQFVPVEEAPPNKTTAKRSMLNHHYPVKKDDPMAKAREFETIKKMSPDGKVLLGAKVTCCKCGRTEEYFKATGSVNPAYLPKEFERLGWIVGASARNDLCPEHAKPIRSPRDIPAVNEKAAAPIFASSPVNSAPAMKEEQPVTVAFMPKPVVAEEIKVPVIKTEGERPMDRTERRLIFARLNEVYLDETKGYSADWTDAKVADDMGVPVKWISEVREADFGPETNATMQAKQHEDLMTVKGELERMIVLIDKKIETAQALDAKVKTALEEMNAAIDRAEQLAKNIADEDARMETQLNGFDVKVEEFKKKLSDLNRSPSAA